MFALKSHIFALILAFAQANIEYEMPIRLAYPGAEGIYEFEMIVEKRLTMSRDMDKYNGKYGDALLDYDPETKTWTQRERDVFTPCEMNHTILNANDSSSLLKSELLETVIQHHGKHTTVVTINGKSPGDVIVVPLGAKVVLRVKNRLFSEAITVHLHGVDKRNAWFTDGVAFLQQCPIPPGSEYVYRFIADTPGTHWYHGHLMNDRADGLLGGFVILRPDETHTDANGAEISIEREYYSILQDWNTATSAEQWHCHSETTMKWVGHGFDDRRNIWTDYRQLWENTDGNATNTTDAVDSGDRGHSSQSCWAPKRTFDGSNIGGSVPLAAIIVGSRGWYDQADLRERPGALPLTTYLIRAGENILLRLVNGGVSHGIMISIEAHSLLVVAADGENVVPREVHAVIIFPGERYDVVVRGMTAPTKPIYRILFETLEYFNWDWTHTLPQVGLANLLYEKVRPPADYDENYVDFDHRNCTQSARCEVLNCNFERFPPSFNFTCISVDQLESAEPITDFELVSQTQFTSGYREVFANMNFDNHFDGWMYKAPRGMPYFYHDDNEKDDEGPENEKNRLDMIAHRCDPTRCNRFGGEHWDSECACFIHYKFHLGDIVQMTIYNMGDKGTFGDGYAHPLHIHGTHFYLLHVGYARYHANNASIRAMNPDIPCYDDTQRCIDLHWANLTWMNGNVPFIPKRPSYRDTVNIPTGGYVTLRFRTTNPGWWFAHCHLLLHHMGGTAFAFRVGTHAETPTPPNGFPHSCGVYEQRPLTSLKLGGGASVVRPHGASTILFAVFVPLLAVYFFNTPNFSKSFLHNVKTSLQIIMLLASAYNK